jgi:hypothetical protein
MADKIKMAAKHEFSIAQSITNQLKLGIWKELPMKKYCRSNSFSKLQDGGLNQDGVSNHCFFLLALTQSFLNRF